MESTDLSAPLGALLLVVALYVVVKAARLAVRLAMIAVVVVGLYLLATNTGT
ncbi:MAG: hypothetical protein KY434_06340 [Actinobacteria bacterium]|nr:hypothetical protein [Actinomycetota bacterium]